LRIFRQLSTPRLLALIAAAVAAAAAASVIVVAAAGSSAQTPPAKPLDQALVDATSAAEPAGVTARVRFTNNLFPSGALSGVTGTEGSALMSGATGRLWWSPGRGRIELQSNSGDTQILWDEHGATVYDSSSNTVYRLPVTIPTRSANEKGPSLAEIDSFLKRLAENWTISDAAPSDVADQPAYTVTVSPAHSAGLLGSLELAWDANHGIPLEIAVRAEGQSTPVLGLTVTDISYGQVSESDLVVTPPANAKTVDLRSTAGVTKTKRSKAEGRRKHVTGLAAVQARLPFTVSAPGTLVGLPRKRVQLIGGSEKGALVFYGRGLGAIVVVEREAKTGWDKQFSQLPEVAIGSTTGHELATALGTIIAFDKGDVSYLVAGSLPASAAETAARSLQ
jgi:outer membrane lipoprotein-sorting protein